MDQSLEVQKADPRTITVAGDHVVVVGVDAIEAEDVATPRVRLMQPMSEMDEAEGKPGQFFFTLFGTYHDTIKAVVIGFKKGRVYWDKGDLGADPLCGSDDAVVPSVRVETPLCVSCLDCDFAKWGEKRSDGKSEPPSCNLSYNYLLALSDVPGMVAQFSVRSTGVPPMKMLNRLLVQASRPRGKHFEVEFYSEFVSKDKKKWYIPRFRVLEAVDRDRLAMAFSMADVEITTDLEQTLDPTHFDEDDLPKETQGDPAQGEQLGF